jgi:hypothetical protein
MQEKSTWEHPLLAEGTRGAGEAGGENPTALLISSPLLGIISHSLSVKLLVYCIYSDYYHLRRSQMGSISQGMNSLAVIATGARSKLNLIS